MSKLCDIYWRQRVMGHWQYILYVNTILFVLHCIISLCSFIIPVRIQSFFGNFWSAEDFIWTMCFSLKKKKKKKKRKNDLLFPLHCDGELIQRLPEMLPVCRRTTDSKHQDLSWPTGVPAGVWPMARRSKVASWPTPPLHLWLTVAYFDPLSDE